MRKFVAAVAVLGTLAFAERAYAGGHWLISNINQIKPSVRAQLQGTRGPQGLTGTQGPQGPQGPSGSPGPQRVPGAAGGARAVAIVNPDGSMVHEVGSPKGITGISHKPNSGIYRIGLSGGIDPSDAMATLTINSNNGGDLNTEPTAPDCAQGQAQADTFELEQSGTTTAGAPLNEVLADQGFVVMVP